MTTAETWTYLNQIYRIEETIRVKIAEHDALQSALLPRAITYDADKVQTSPSDAMSKIAGTVIDLEKEIRQMERDKLRLVSQISTDIGLLDNPVERIILLRHFVKLESMREIADLETYSYNHVFKIRRNAVRHLRDKLSG